MAHNSPVIISPSKLGVSRCFRNVTLEDQDQWSLAVIAPGGGVGLFMGGNTTVVRPSLQEHDSRQVGEIQACTLSQAQSGTEKCGTGGRTQFTSHFKTLIKSHSRS